MGVVALLIQELAGAKNVFLLTYVSIPHGVIPVNSLFLFVLYFLGLGLIFYLWRITPLTFPKALSL